MFTLLLEFNGIALMDIYAHVGKHRRTAEGLYLLRELISHFNPFGETTSQYFTLNCASTPLTWHDKILHTEHLRRMNIRLVCNGYKCNASAPLQPSSQLNALVFSNENAHADKELFRDSNIYIHMLPPFLWCSA
uniref:Uncharacterized protein n=1 Tax=Glossina palpalis gambiensis TaxID=67801 RepID=A0A1B0B3Q0_9MUSC